MNPKQFVESINVPSGVSRRYDCPVCGGKNTFSVSNVHGQLKWYCFKADCHTKGRQDTEKTAEDIKTSLLSKPENGTNLSPLLIPDYWTSPLSEEKAVDYIVNNHCMYAYKNQLATIRFDPRQRRVVFCVEQEGTIVDAAGRALDKGTTPKWYRYAHSGVPFICGTSDVGVIVEDCASACAVSPVATGIALLGTNLKDSYLGALVGFKELYVCLDKDASNKAIAMQRGLSYYAPTKVRLLEEDLKYCDADKVREVLIG